MLEFADLRAYEWMNIPAWVYDCGQFRHWWANAAGLRFWKSDSLDELCSRSYSDTSQTTRARLALAMHAHANGETTCERWTLYPRGTPASILLQGTGIRLPDGRAGILFMAELGMQMEPSVIRGVEILNHASVLLCVHRLSDGEGLMRNPAAELAFGRICATPDANFFVKLFADAEVGKAVLASVRAGEAVHMQALLRTRPEPSWQLVGVRQALDPATGEQVIILHASDVSELMETQRTLELSRERAEAASRAKTAFLSTMNHELRTPINGILGTLHLLDRSRLDDRQHRWVEMALESGAALSSLIGDLVELAAIDGGDSLPTHELFDLHAVVKAAISPLKPEALRKRLGFTCQCAPDVPARIVGDARWTRRIVFNLAANAVKFTAAGSVTVTVTACDLEQAHHCVRLDVVDTGPGIAHAQQEAIFRPFMQLDQTSTRERGGVGMGLTLVRKMVDRLGGFLELDSTPGKGSRFSVILPIG